MKQVHIRVDELYEKLDRKKSPSGKGLQSYIFLFIYRKQLNLKIKIVPPRLDVFLSIIILSFLSLKISTTAFSISI